MTDRTYVATERTSAGQAARSAKVYVGSTQDARKADARSNEEVERDLLRAVGARVRALRERRRIRPADFARAADMAQQYLWRVEEGRQNLSLLVLARVAGALDVPMSDLLEGLDPLPGSLGRRAYRKCTAVGPTRS